MYKGLRTKLTALVKDEGGNRLRLVYRGKDMQELAEQFSFSEVAFHHCVGRLPTGPERQMMDTILIAGIDHSIVAGLPARITISRAPEAFQGAVAVGLMSMGTRRGLSASGVAQMLQEALQARDGRDLREVAQAIDDDHAARRIAVPGIGNPVHKNIEPRAKAVMDRATSLGIVGEHTRLLQTVAELTSARVGKHLPINFSGAVGGVLSDMDIEWRLASGFLLIARSAGLVANVHEELSSPTSSFFDREVTGHMDEIYEGERLELDESS